MTLGPRGRNVVLMREVGYPEVVNDGVTIARDINLAGKHLEVPHVSRIAACQTGIAMFARLPAPCTRHTLPPTPSSGLIISLHVTQPLFYPHADITYPFSWVGRRPG